MSCSFILPMKKHTNTKQIKMESRPNLLPLLLFSLLLFPFSAFADAPGGCTAHDKAVLLQVKSHFGGVGLLSEWDPSDDCCDWPFIGCPTEGSNYGRVTALTVSGGTGLSGTIPDVIGDLPYLKEIMFFDEPKLTGPIPQSFSKLTNLQIIYLNSNSLSGSIPAFLGKLKKLQQIDISSNRFTGSIPSSLSGLTALSAFNVSHNMLTGSIPSLSKSLTSFDVSYNQLCGMIPKGLQKFNSTAFGHNKCLCGHPLPACKK